MLRKFSYIVSATAAALMALMALTALASCGGGGDLAAQSAAQSAGGGNAAVAAGAVAGSAAQAPGAVAGSAVEAPDTPLTGEVKQKVEQAALVKFPGTVVKSEMDRERPGMYAVEVQLTAGGGVEVYLDKSLAVVGTKREGTDKGGDD